MNGEVNLTHGPQSHSVVRVQVHAREQRGFLESSGLGASGALIRLVGLVMSWMSHPAQLRHL